MRSFIVSIFSLALISSVFAAPTHDSANDCSIDGTCVAPRELKARGCGVYYGSDVYDNEYSGFYSGRNKRGVISGDEKFDPFEACLDENGEEITVTATATNVAEVTAVAFQPPPASAPAAAAVPVSAPHSNSHGGLLSGLLGSLLGSNSHPASGQELAGSTNNDNDHLIDLDLTATVDAGNLLQATATVDLGLL